MSLRHLIQHNFWLKLFSLLLATLIWFTIKFWIRTDSPVADNPINPDRKEYLNLPVYVLSHAGDARVFKVTPPTVGVTVTAESAWLRDLPRKDLKAYVDMTDIRHNESASQKIRLHVPNNITVIRVLPLAVSVEQVSP